MWRACRPRGAGGVVLGANRGHREMSGYVGGDWEDLLLAAEEMEGKEETGEDGKEICVRPVAWEDLEALVM